jgi:hypothetical protein
MSALTDYAEGKDCQIRIPGVCSFQNDQTVACHVPLAGYHGTGLKTDDWFAAWGCFNCHDAVDRRRYKHLEREWVRNMHLEAMLRTQAAIIETAPHLVINFLKRAA